MSCHRRDADNAESASLRCEVRMARDLLPASFRGLTFRAQLLHPRLGGQSGAAGAGGRFRVRRAGRRSLGGRVLGFLRSGARLGFTEILRQVISNHLRKLVLIPAAELQDTDREVPLDLRAYGALLLLVR